MPLHQKRFFKKQFWKQFSWLDITDTKKYTNFFVFKNMKFFKYLMLEWVLYQGVKTSDYQPSNDFSDCHQAIRKKEHADAKATDKSLPRKIQQRLRPGFALVSCIQYIGKNDRGTKLHDITYHTALHGPPFTAFKIMSS